MQSPVRRIRATVDRLNKSTAARPAMPTGKDMRTQEEVLGTGAAARAIAMMRSKIPAARKRGRGRK